VFIPVNVEFKKTPKSETNASELRRILELNREKSSSEP
jgi:hypothetical protein